MIHLVEPGLAPAPRTVEASTVTVVPEAQAPHGEIPVSSEAGHGEEAVSAPVQGDGFDQHACDGGLPMCTRSVSFVTPAVVPQTAARSCA